MPETVPKLLPKDRPRIEVDHLVVAARTLDEGVAWCEATLGVAPEPGGRHALMGTHNRLLSIGSARYPRSFLEIIAIDASAVAPQRVRWFDLDAPAMQQVLCDGPQLVHWVARTGDIAAGTALLRSAGHDPGTPTVVDRMTSRGLLRWQLTLREDGRRLAAGAVPLLIEWGAEHPCDSLGEHGLALERVELGGVSPGIAAMLGVGAAKAGAGPALKAVLTTPRGRVELDAPASFTG